jgi:hypothetical protein
MATRAAAAGGAGALAAGRTVVASMRTIAAK